MTDRFFPAEAQQSDWALATRPGSHAGHAFRRGFQEELRKHEGKPKLPAPFKVMRHEQRFFQAGKEFARHVVAVMGVIDARAEYNRRRGL